MNYLLGGYNIIDQLSCLFSLNNQESSRRHKLISLDMNDPLKRVCNPGNYEQPITSLLVERIQNNIIRLLIILKEKRTDM